MKFRNWLIKNEMASFSLTGNHFEIPCNNIGFLPCIEKPVGAIDMRFEDPGAYSPPYNKLTNHSRFSALIPKSDNILIYHGDLKKNTEILPIEIAIKNGFIPMKDNKIDRNPGAISENGYFMIPDNWFIQAQILDTDYNLIKPALADENGKRLAALSH